CLIEKNDEDNPPQFVLGIRLQRYSDSGGHGRALSVLATFIKPDLCVNRHGHEFSFSGIKLIALKAEKN
ncbi:MAG: hypothetical protein ACD_68C00066G0001, partial [uncultured bacterium]